MDPLDEIDMLRRKRAPSGIDTASPQIPPSNISVRFNVRADKSSEFVDFTHTPVLAVGDGGTPLSPLVDKVPIPPPRRIFNALDGSTVHPSTDHTTASSPIVERISSFRDNLHNIRERFASRKGSDVGDEKERLTAQTPGEHQPTFMEKIAKKIDERRMSHKDGTSGASSPTKDLEYPSHSYKVGAYNPRGSNDSLPNVHESKIQPAVVESYGATLSDSSLPSSIDPNVFPGKKEQVPTSTGQPGPPFPTEPRKSYAGGKGVDPIEKPGLGDRKLDHRGRSETTDFDALRGGLSSLPPLLFVCGLLIAVVVAPMPSFMSGLLFGCIITAAASVRVWFTVLFPRKPKEMYGVPPVAAALINGDPSTRYPQPQSRLNEPPSTWMNQLVGEFDTATFHVNQTQSVYVSLDGSDLRVRKPKTRIVPRRAMFDEEMESETFTFSESRIYKIAGAEISLVPADIPRKRRWLWRFPIGIKLADSQSIDTLMDEIRQKTAKHDDKDDKKKDKDKDKHEVREVTPVKDSNMLYILPRSDREKEVWYWRLVAAAGKVKFPTMRPNLSPNLSTLNVLFHRIAYDVLTEPTWEEVIRKKIQKKLSIIRLPIYIEELQITDLDLGRHLPIISNVVEKPDIDERGIWIEMDFEYHGTVLMTLATKLNLMKLKKGNEDSEDKHDHKSDVQLDSISVNSIDSASTNLSSSTAHEKRRVENLYDSDEADEFDENAPVAAEGGKQKVMRLVEKITESKAFQKLTDVGVVRRAMENVSETDLCLTVVIERLAGRLALNVPHPPSDKMWWGFVSKPDLHLKAFPKLGEREVTFDKVTDWIEKKMTSEFHRLITVPNMDDISVPLMNSTLDDPKFRMEKLCDLILK